MLWPYDGVATRGSDTVQAPSQHLIHLMGGPSGRSHRLCLEAGSTSAHLDEWLRLLSVPPDGGGGGGGGGGVPEEVAPDGQQRILGVAMLRNTHRGCTA